MLRDASKGDQAAIQQAARLFNISPQKDSGEFFQFTVKLDRVTLEKSEAFQYKFIISDGQSREAVQNFFSNGNGWSQHYDPTDFMQVTRSPEEVRANVKKALSAVMDPVSSHNENVAFFGLKRCMSYVIQTTGEGSSSISYAYNRDTDKCLSDLTEAWTTALMASVNLDGVPVQSQSFYQNSQPWGIRDIGSFAIVFVPQKYVKNHPSMSIYGWLHPYGKPDELINATRGEATDFVNRCLETAPDKINIPVYAPGVGKICWFAFPIFDSAMGVKLKELREPLDSQRGAVAPR